MLLYSLQYFSHLLDQFNSSLIIYHNLSLPRNSVNMISSLKMVIPLLFLVILGCDGVGRDIDNFLRDQGWENLTQTFVSEEIEVRHVNRLTDQNLMDLAVRTMGARLRLQSAATAWVSPQVTCLFLHKKLSCQILFYLKPPN